MTSAPIPTFLLKEGGEAGAEARECGHTRFSLVVLSCPFFKKILTRGHVRESERDHRLVAFRMRPDLTGDRTETFWYKGRRSNQLIHPAGAAVLSFLLENNLFAVGMFSYSRLRAPSSSPPRPTPFCYLG